MVRSVTLASLALVALAPLARSQEYREVLTAQFQAVEENMATKGWTHDRAAFPGDVAVHFLEAGAQVGLEIDLQAGADYMILGACDRNCTDLDLTLMDMAGKRQRIEVMFTRPRDELMGELFDSARELENFGTFDLRNQRGNELIFVLRM